MCPFWASSRGPERTHITLKNPTPAHSRFRRRVQVAHPNIFNFLRHLRDVAVDLMSDAVRLEQHAKELNGERL